MCTSAAPGMRRDLLAQPLRDLVVGRRRSLPTTCRSIGAGRPKFRIWFVMFAGSKKNTMSGNFSVSRLRSWTS